MSVHETKEQLAKWLDQWDKALEEMAKEEKVQPKAPKEVSFFDNTPNVDNYEDSGETGGEDEFTDWREIYRRALAIDNGYEEGDYEEDSLLTEQDEDVLDDDSEGVKKDGFGPLVRGNKQITKGDITYQYNPINVWSVGPDQQGDDGHVRVTPNFSGGNEIDELSDIKIKVERLEQAAHETDVRNDKATRDKILKELKSLRKQIQTLSEKLVPRPENDVS